MKACVLSLLIIVTSFSVFGQPGAVMTGIAAKDAINTLTGRLDDLRANAEISLNATAQNAINSLDYYLNALQQQGDHWLNDADYILKSTEMQLINDIQVAGDNLINGVTEKTDDLITKSSLQLINVLNTLPFTNKTPRITSYQFPVLLKNQSNSDILLKFSGAYLENRQNKLFIDGKHFTALSYNGNELTYLIPKKALLTGVDNQSEVHYRTLSVKLFSKGWLLGKNKEVGEFSFSIKSVPEAIGKVVPRFRARYDSIIHEYHNGTLMRGGCCGCGSSACTSNTTNHMRPPVKTIDGRQIQFKVNLDSMRANKFEVIDRRVQNRCNSSSNVTLLGYTEDQVTTHAYMRSHTPDFQGLQYSDEHCFTDHGANFWTFGIYEGFTTNVSLQESSMNNGNDISYEIPMQFQQKFNTWLDLKLVAYDGSTSILTPSKNKGGGIQADFNIENQQVIVRPNPIGFK